jgi:aminoglycoside phosphotransferase (APT) family kinase protein
MDSLTCGVSGVAGSSSADPFASPLRAVVACGWLNEADVPYARVELTTSSHDTFRVVAPDGRIVIVKHPNAQALANGRDLGRELFVYRLAGWIPQLASTVPRARVVDEAHQVLVMEAVGGPTAWPPVLDAGAPLSLDVASRLGTLMAGWHAATQDLALWSSPAVGILHLPDAVEHAVVSRSSAAQELMRSITSDQELAAALRETRNNWRDRCLIHGDVRRENWIAERTSSRAGVRVIDWELSGSGDPAWDLGSVVADAALDVVRNVEVGDKPWSWRPHQNPGLGKFLARYVTGGGLLRPREQEDWVHVTLCTAARLIHIATEWAEMQDSLMSGPAPHVVELARHVLRHRSEIAGALRAAAVR